MTTSFHDIAGGLHGAVARSRGLDVIYRRDAAEVAITAVPGRSTSEVIDDSGVGVHAVERDWLILAADLVIGAEAITPKPGDQIRLAVGTQVQVFEVAPLGGDKCYRPSDDLGTVLRVHTRHSDTEDAT